LGLMSNSQRAADRRRTQGEISRELEAGADSDRVWSEGTEVRELQKDRIIPMFLAATDGSEASFHTDVHYGDVVAELERAGREATARIASLAVQIGVECREMLVSGKPYRAIVSLAAECVVQGTHGGSPFERMALGKVSEKVLHLADRLVLVVGGGNTGRPPQETERPTAGMSAG
jgi:nucleotide-binding universal stress UspA family protein